MDHILPNPGSGGGGKGSENGTGGKGAEKGFYPQITGAGI